MPASCRWLPTRPLQFGPTAWEGSNFWGSARCLGWASFLARRSIRVGGGEVFVRRLRLRKPYVRCCSFRSPLAGRDCRTKKERVCNGRFRYTKRVGKLQRAVFHLCAERGSMFSVAIPPMFFRALQPFWPGPCSIFCSMPTEAPRPNCVNYNRCGRRAKGPRARFCTSCFRANAVLLGGASAGNTSANRWRGGNTSADRRWLGGNTKKGRVKKQAGARSGVRRSAKKALVVKKQWLDLILAGRKTWEIRGSSTAKRGWIHLAESQAGGIFFSRRTAT